MSDKKECNLCGWICPEDDMEIRKERHEQGRHTRHTVISERDGSKSKPMGNFIYGKVTWI